MRPVRMTTQLNYKHMQACTQMCVHTYTNTQIHKLMGKQTHIDRHTHTCTHTHTHTHTYDSLIQSYHSSRVATEMAPRNDKKKRKHWDKWHRHYKKEAICLANDDSPFGTGSYRQLLSANDNTVCSTPNGKTWGNINKSKHSRLTAIALIRSSSSFVFPHRVKGPP